MIYLKTIFSAPNEVKFLKLQLKEAFPYIEKFFVCEFNRTHTGQTRELIFNNFLNQFTEEEINKIIYIGADISKESVDAINNNKLAHNNEQLIRGYFAGQINLKDEDIIFSVDADEIIFGYQYPRIMAKLGFFTPAIKLQLHQFFYRINYLWENNNFIAPTVCKAKYYKKKYPGQWRYNGKLYPEIAGCHFSWCLTIEEMIKKLNTYAHQYEYGHLAKREILEDAIKNKKYPFDPKVDFRIKVLDINKDREYYPSAIYTMMDEFKELIVPICELV